MTRSQLSSALFISHVTMSLVAVPFLAFIGWGGGDVGLWTAFAAASLLGELFVLITLDKRLRADDGERLARVGTTRVGALIAWSGGLFASLVLFVTGCSLALVGQPAESVIPGGLRPSVLDAFIRWTGLSMAGWALTSLFIGVAFARVLERASESGHRSGAES